MEQEEIARLKKTFLKPIKFKEKYYLGDRVSVHDWQGNEIPISKNTNSSF